MSNKIFLQSSKQHYTLSGAIELLQRRDLLHLKRVYKAETSAKEIKIKKKLNENEKIIAELADFFKKRELILQLDTASDQTLQQLFDEEDKFQQFSKKAQMIWHNQHTFEDFESFCLALNNNMTRTLYELQLLSAYHLAFSQNSCNFSVPGAGKTSIVYGAYTYLRSLGPHSPKYVDKILMIGPLSSFGPWEQEYEACFGRRPIRKRISSELSQVQKNNYFYSNKVAELTLISYQGVISQKEQIIYFLKNNNVMVILDEAHKIKNTNGGIIAEIVLEFAKFCKSRVVLTGTPAPNGYRDLANLFQFIWPSRKIIPYGLNQLDDMTTRKGDLRVNDLIEKISPYFIRIKKSDLNLPPKVEHPLINIPMDAEQEYIYKLIEKKIMKNMVNQQKSGGILEQFQQARLIRLMQAASNPRLLLSPIEENLTEDFNLLNDLDQDLVDTITQYDRKKMTPRTYDKAVKLIKELMTRNEKVIVWVNYIKTIHLFGELLDSHGITYKTLYGATPIEGDNQNEEIETRESIVKEFNAPTSSFNVIIANPYAVAESISLHKGCHNAIYLERNFDGARYVQSKDRIHRYGLPPDVITEYFYIVPTGTIAETVHQRLIDKEELIIRVTESKDIPLFTLLDDEDNEDLKMVINDYAKRSKF